MKYPYIIFYRYDKYNSVDRFFIDNGPVLECTIFIANNIENVNYSFEIQLNY